MAAPPLLLCFQISQLLAFYARTVAGLIGARSQLADALAGCCKLARRVFAEQLKARGDRLLRYPPAPPADLSPPPQVGPRLYACCRLYLSASTSDSKTAGAKFRPVTLSPGILGIKYSTSRRICAWRCLCDCAWFRGVANSDEVLRRPEKTYRWSSN
jgi:hypothetical protein